MKLFQVEEKKISDIIIKDRIRNDVGDITSLANSISMIGQLTPILIDENNVLLDGLHRMKACESLDQKTIEVRIATGIADDDYTLIELLSNMDRKEFTWYEEIELKEKLHNFWLDEAKEAKRKWGYRETARRLQCSLGGLSTDLAFAEALKVFPELKKQSTKGRARDLYKAFGDKATAIQSMGNFTDVEKDRLKELQSGVMPIISKPLEKPLEKEETGETEETLMVEQPVEDFSSISVVYVSENYKTFIDKIPNESVGMVELDPPYAIDFDNNYGKTSKIRSKASDWTEKELYEFYHSYLPLIYDKMLDSSWVLCWTGKKHLNMIQEVAKGIGFYTQSPGVWVKPGGGSTNQPKRTLISNWEMYLLFRKGKAQFNVPSMLSALNMTNVHTTNRIHQWEKPIELYDYFLNALGKPGSIFLSPFAGSGNCLISAAKFKMTPIGCDKSQRYIPQFYQRLEQHTGIKANLGIKNK